MSGWLCSRAAGSSRRRCSGTAGLDLPPPEEASDVEAAGHDYRGRVVSLDEPNGPSIELAILRPASVFSPHIADSRLLIGRLPRAVPRAGARLRDLRGPRAHRPDRDLPRRRPAALARATSDSPSRSRATTSSPQLGREFNNMSEQLEAKIEEVERKRHELEETIRRVGDAFATGLDRQGVVELAVRTAVDACEAEAGARCRSRTGRSRATRWARSQASSRRAIEAAERHVFGVRPDVGLGAAGRPRGRRGPERTRRAVSAHGGRRPRAVDRTARRSSSGPGVPRARSRSPAAASRSRARRASCSSTWPARPWSRSRTRPPRDGPAPGGHRRADRARERARVHTRSSTARSSAAGASTPRSAS